MQNFEVQCVSIDYLSRLEYPNHTRRDISYTLQSNPLTLSELRNLEAENGTD